MLLSKRPNLVTRDAVGSLVFELCKHYYSVLGMRVERYVTHTATLLYMLALSLVSSRPNSYRLT